MPDDPLRDAVTNLLRGEGAHATFDDAVEGVTGDELGRRVDGVRHTVWRLVDHLRIAQRDLLEYSRNPDHVSPHWPNGYWPHDDAPRGPDPLGDFETMCDAFREDNAALVGLVRNASVDLLAPIPFADGNTLLRNCLVVADHNAYHLGQLIVLRRALGTWRDD